jgi:regulatory protein
MRTRRSRPSASPGQVAERKRLEQLSTAVWNLLSLRARSRGELRSSLLRRGFDGDDIDRELDRLTQLGFIDDAAFARLWVASRGSGSAPKGPGLLRAELRRKGIDADTIRVAVDGSEEGTAVVVAARRRGSRLRLLPYHEFRQRLLAYLLRRGFDYEVARPAVQDAWRELSDEDERVTGP